MDSTEVKTMTIGMLTYFFEIVFKYCNILKAILIISLNNPKNNGIK